MITFAQNFEDVMLERLFEEKQNGFYVDVGAWDPTVMSVTRHFYNKGWRGINIEPITARFELFNRERIRDVNLNVVVGARTGSTRFFECPEDQNGQSFLSTVNEDVAQKMRKQGLSLIERQVEVLTLTEILEQHGEETIDFLKIDVEGHEADVLQGTDFGRFRPRALVIEATLPAVVPQSWERIDEIGTWETWEPALLKEGYHFAYFDGLNRFYLRSEDHHLAQRLAIPPCVFDHIETTAMQQELVALSEDRNAKEIVIRQLSAELDARNRSDPQQLIELKNEISKLAGQPQVLDSLKRIEAKLSALETKRISLLRPRDLVLAIMRAALRPPMWTFEQYPPRHLDLSSLQPPVQMPALPPRIAIVTPTYNYAQFLEATIDSVLGQSYPNLFYHVQDSLSKDGTVTLLQKYADKISWRSEADKGQADGINLGFVGVECDIMGYLNSDDALLPGTLSYIADYFQKNPKIDLVYGHRIFIDREGMEVGRAVLPPFEGKSFQYACYIPQETLFWRRKVWDRLGGIDSEFQFAMDWDFALRAQAEGFKFARLPRFLGCFRVHDQQKTAANLAIGNQEMKKLRERNLGFVPSHHEILRAIYPYLLRHYVYHWAYKFGLLSY